MSSRDYFVFVSCDDSEWVAGPMTKEEVERGLESENWSGTFYEKAIRTDSARIITRQSQKHGLEAALVIRGEIVIPKPIDHVTKWEIER